MKSPQTLFSTFKRPDHVNRRNRPKDLHKRQVFIQPNIVLPQSTNIQKHSNHPNVYANKRMNIPAAKQNVILDYKNNNFAQPTIQPNLPNPINSIYNISIPTTDNQSKFYADNKRFFGLIQKQMAQCQIPMCLVQDERGKLHQLVYTLPEKVYQEYIQNIHENKQPNPKQQPSVNDTNKKDELCQPAVLTKRSKNNNKGEHPVQTPANFSLNLLENLNSKDRNHSKHIKSGEKTNLATTSYMQNKKISSDENFIERLANRNRTPSQNIHSNNISTGNNLHKDNQNNVAVNDNLKHPQTKVSRSSHVEKQTSHVNNVVSTQLNVLQNDKSETGMYSEPLSTVNSFKQQLIESSNNEKCKIDQNEETNSYLNQLPILTNQVASFANQIPTLPNQIPSSTASEVSLKTNDDGSEKKRRAEHLERDLQLHKFLKTLNNDRIDINNFSGFSTDLKINSDSNYENVLQSDDLPSISSTSVSSIESSNDSPINYLSLNSVASSDTEYGSINDDNLNLFETTELQDFFQDFSANNNEYLENMFNKTENGFGNNDYFDISNDLYADDEPLDFRIFERNSFLTGET